MLGLPGRRGFRLGAGTRGAVGGGCGSIVNSGSAARTRTSISSSPAPFAAERSRSSSRKRQSSGSMAKLPLAGSTGSFHPLATSFPSRSCCCRSATMALLASARASRTFARRSAWYSRLRRSSSGQPRRYLGSPRLRPRGDLSAELVICLHQRRLGKRPHGFAQRHSGVGRRSTVATCHLDLSSGAPAGRIASPVQDASPFLPERNRKPPPGQQRERPARPTAAPARLGRGRRDPGRRPSCACARRASAESRSDWTSRPTRACLLTG